MARAMMLAPMKAKRSILATPAAMVTTLKGIGVMPLMMTAGTP